MEENEKGYYSSIEKEILILVDTITEIIKRTGMLEVNKGMAQSIQSQMYSDRETIRKHAAGRNKVAYSPLPESMVVVEDLKEVNEVEIDQIYERIEGVYFSLIKYEQSLKV